MKLTIIAIYVHNSILYYCYTKEYFRLFFELVCISY